MFSLLNLVEYYRIRKECKKCEKNLIFDMKYLDERISKFADKIYSKNQKLFIKQASYVSVVGFMASELYDLGGHTPCLVNLAESLYENKKMPLFITRINSTYKRGKRTMNKLAKCCDIFGVDFHSYKFVSSLIELYNKIVQNPPKVMFLYVHQHDILATALIHLLKVNTDIKFAFFDHASHFPNLGMTMANIIIEELTYTAKTLVEKRHITDIPYRKCGLQSKRKEDVKYYLKEELDKKRKELGVKEKELLTVSGGSSYKYFEENGSTHYEMIKEILEKTPNLKHLAITNLTPEQVQIVDRIFENSPDAKKRLIFHQLTPQFDILFQCADLFIDSFPISSAMTQIDLMGMKVPTVVKINLENPTWTFHEYMPEDYPYMYERVEDMEKGILYLLSNKEERKKIAENNYQHWLVNYENDVVKEKYQDIIKEVLS